MATVKLTIDGVERQLTDEEKRMLAWMHLSPSEKQTEIDRRKAKQRQLTDERNATLTQEQLVAESRERLEHRAADLLERKAAIEAALAVPEIAAVVAKFPVDSLNRPIAPVGGR
jgi:hypothetical protein